MSAITLKLKKIDPIKWAIIAGVFYGIISLIVVIPMFLFMPVLGSGIEEAGLGVFGSGIMMLFLPILYGVFGFIFGLIAAYLLNFILSKTDGLNMDFEKVGVEVSEI